MENIKIGDVVAYRSDSTVSEIIRKITGANAGIENVLATLPGVNKSNELSKFDSNNLVNLPRSENRLLSLVLGGKETKEKMLQGHRNMLEVIEDVKAGKNLPLGYFVRKEAKSRKIPSVTVTSTYHHDLAFEPLRFQLEPYVDNLVEGKKDWKKGFEDLLDPNYRKIYFKE